MTLALITGGGSGIGAVLADRLASRGHDLLLVTRDAGRMHGTARALAARHGVRADVLVADLATRHGLFRLEALLSGPEALAVDVLVHDAVSEVAGTPGVLLTVGQQQSRIDLGVTATMRLTHAALPGMLRRGTGAVVTVGTPALPAEEPSTSWAVAFTSALASTLGGTGVRAVAVRPDGRPGWTGRDGEVVLADLDAGRTVSVPGDRNVLRELPRRVAAAGARAARRGADLLSDVTHQPPAGPPAAAAAVPAVAVDVAGRRPVPAPGCGRTPEEILASGTPGPVRAPSRLPDLPARPDSGRTTVAAPACGRSAHYVTGSLRTAEQRARAAAAARDRARHRGTGTHAVAGATAGH
ncbi:SDR family NAD(P)-dependent oxidoreductase [Pseudonocardia parietis]|uniref:NADP-dependent 3-hydroxy acid dehydrogenase YdfG n=1 Tax=Pseudonocardia parietis TaxID=570936 RepID=A0ABS4VM48_9PSEU|nr:SDR family NAD(P)-dependent oxidoreductase [Pseudonocardia parietis]MBP2365000.1 NADP-dependent 3-hydroxy acid dehydrogenase YdfG [Pseudonocardia parietis]